MKSRKFSAYVKPAIIALICIILMIASGLTGCKLSSIAKEKNAAQAPTPAETEGKTNLNKEEENNTADKDPTPAPVVLYNVLTGLRTTSELAALRPVAVCIENSAYSMPQYGLSKSQILIEAPIENGGTKLMMLTTDYRYMTTIGAVTSTRPYLATLGQAFGAVQCYNGADATMTDEELAVYDSLNAANPDLAGIYYYDATRFSEQDLMTNGILLDSGIRRNELSAEATGIVMPYVFADEDAPVALNGGRAVQASVKYSDDLNVTFTYDASSGEYLRSQFGSATLDGNSGEEVGFENIFLLYASSVVYESETARSLDLVLTDGGTGVYLSNGNSITFTWTMDENGSLHFSDADGKPLTVNRGTSYIGVIPAGQKDCVTIK